MIRAYLRNTEEVLQELQVRGFYADCSALVTDHRLLNGPRDVLIAAPGEKFDPRSLADELLDQQRCGLVLVEQDDRQVYSHAGVVPVLNLKSLLAELAAGYYKTAGNRLAVYAVTGTNGKTTVTRWLAQALGALGKKAAVIGTLGYGLPDRLKSHSGLTTPDVVGIHHILHELKQQGMEAVCVEASSIGLDQQRLKGVRIDGALFTNLSQDHLDYHGSMDAYGSAKLLLAAWPTLQFAVANLDDEFGGRFLAKAGGHGVKTVSVGHADTCTVQVLEVTHNQAGQQIRFNLGEQVRTVDSTVLGAFNADNLALVLATLLQLHYPVDSAVQALADVTPAPGRMQLIEGQPAVVVDYAHTPDALEKTIQALLPYAAKRGGKLSVVFGCGGDRDKTKRPRMGQVAASDADQVWITSDNPRSEQPEQIVKDILVGVPAPHLGKVKVELDRGQAIAQAITTASARDVVLLAGKGHETTQAIGGVILPHSDEQCAKECLAKRGVHV